MWRRVAVFPFNGEVIRSEELFFALQAPVFVAGDAGFTDLERAMGLEHRWFTADEVRALQQCGEPVYPQDLPDLLGGGPGCRREAYRTGGSCDSVTGASCDLVTGASCDSVTGASCELVTGASRLGDRGGHKARSPATGYR